MRSFKWWIGLAAVFAMVFIAWPKTAVKPTPVAPAEHETIFSAIAEGTKEGIGDFVRRDLFRK